MFGRRPLPEVRAGFAPGYYAALNTLTEDPEYQADDLMHLSASGWQIYQGHGEWLEYSDKRLAKEVVNGWRSMPRPISDAQAAELQRQLDA